MKWLAKLRRAIALWAAVLLLSAAFPAQAAEERRLNGKYVFDHADVLSETAEDLINEQSLSLFRETGAEIVIVTTDFLDGKDIDDYTYRKFQSMGIGSKERNNGVLLVLAIADDDYYTMVGYGIDGYFTGGKLQEMLDDYVEPYFAKGEYSKCATQFASAMYTELKDYPYQDQYAGESFHIGGKNAKKSSGSGGGILSTLLWVIPVGLVIFVIARLVIKNRNKKEMAEVALSAEKDTGSASRGESAETEKPASPPSSGETAGSPPGAALSAEKNAGSVSRAESTETEKPASSPPSGKTAGSSSGGDGCGCGVGCSVIIVIAFLILGILAAEGARIGGDSVGLTIVSVIFLFLVFGLPIIAAINKISSGLFSSHGSSYDDSSHSSSHSSSNSNSSHSSSYEDSSHSSSHSSSYDDSSYSSSHSSFYDNSSHSSSHSSSFGSSHSSSHSSSGFSSGGSSRHSSGSGRSGSFSSGGGTRGGGAGRRK